MLAPASADEAKAPAKESKSKGKGENKESKGPKQLPLDKLLHCELLQARIRAIAPKLSEGSQNASRLEVLAVNLAAIRKGDSVSQQKLSDIKFEGQFATKKAGPS